MLRILAIVALLAACKGPVAQEVGVDAEDFKVPVEEAMRLWNGAIGCNAFVKGSDVRILSTDGEPCGKTFSPEISTGHSASTYRCLGVDRGWDWEIHYERPGNLRTQTCIALHELGHVAGLLDSDNPSDTMHVKWCPPDGQLLWPNDHESAAVRKKLCR
jgi:hypothetical protein